MGILDVGGGLAVDYDGSQTNFPSSRNYTPAGVLRRRRRHRHVLHGRRRDPAPHDRDRERPGHGGLLLRAALQHPGRATGWTTARSSPCSPRARTRRSGGSLETYGGGLEEEHPGGVPRRPVLPGRGARAVPARGARSLRERGLADQIFWSIIARIRKEARGLKHVPEELEGIDAALTSIYYGNFSVFQSLPDLWAIEQLFPIMPIHRLKERPRNQAIISDTTCDSDGQDRALHRPARRGALDPAARPRARRGLRHRRVPGRRLPGDPGRPAQPVRRHQRRERGARRGRARSSTPRRSRATRWRTCSPTSSTSPKILVNRFRTLVESALRQKRITVPERNAAMQAYETGMRGYTYFEE